MKTIKISLNICYLKLLIMWLNYVSLNIFDDWSEKQYIEFLVQSVLYCIYIYGIFQCMLTNQQFIEVSCCILVFVFCFSFVGLFAIMEIRQHDSKVRLESATLNISSGYLYNLFEISKINSIIHFSHIVKRRKKIKTANLSIRRLAFSTICG